MKPVDVRSLLIKTLGPCTFESPLLPLLDGRGQSYHYVDERDRVLFDDTVSAVSARAVDRYPSFEPAGPRRKLFFNPAQTRAGIVTCGGLCPGLNDVIRALTLELHLRYGVEKVYGFKNGYQGLVEKCGRPLLELTPDRVGSINEHGGTMLGTSRGQQDPEEMLDYLIKLGVNVLFVIGGDGSIRGAQKISEAAAQRNVPLAVAAIPKTIDNDIMFIEQSFGFQTSFTEATRSIRGAHVEAQASPNGIGLVKLMGRHSGFIACYASLAMSDTDFVLIPEVPFQLEGPGGFLKAVRERVERQGHAVIVVAEGAGQAHCSGGDGGTDASGNAKLKDVGVFLKQQICDDFAKAGLEVNLKYIDPSYAIRSVPANAYDSVYCIRLAHSAVHAAMSGRTELVIGRWHSRFVHVPMSLAIRERYTVDPDGDLWTTVLEATGQPRLFA